MGQSRLLHGHIVLLRQQRLVAGQLGGKKSQHGGVIPQLGQLVPQDLGGTLGQVTEISGQAGLHLRLAAGIQQNVDAPGAELAQVAVADGGHIIPPGRPGDGVAGSERQQVAVTVIDGLCAGKAMQTKRDLRAVFRLLRPVVYGGGKAVLRAAQGLHRLADKGAVGGKIQEGDRQGQQDQQTAAEVGRPAAQQRPQK